ncbi:hypothetical protein GCM10023193_22570 [Planotetraspora kaengkrachanensis]|uniref:Uncharacterized protein n=1 Tax=Planotetraspora kaengkrachanensis TaxID=575193 RepID=A0A8J3M657_9ACTN|nr:hypothetical protein Pka01_31580 [Planotetraspora kaengkrachanensis]
MSRGTGSALVVPGEVKGDLDAGSAEILRVPREEMPVIGFPADLSQASGERLSPAAGQVVWAEVRGQPSTADCRTPCPRAWPVDRESMRRVGRP